MKDRRFPDVSGLLSAFGAAGASEWNGTGRLHGEVPDYERKYEANGKDKPLPMRKLEFQALMLHLSSGPDPAFEIIRSESFSGIDECFEFDAGNGEVITFRLRFGSNRSCQLSMKIRSAEGDGTERQRCSFTFEHPDFDSARAMFLRISQLIGKGQHLFIGQAGEFWFVKDPSGYVVEIVLYKAGRVDPGAQSDLLLLAEISPRGCPSRAVAIEVIEKLERKLRLSGRRRDMPNTELFKVK